MTNNFFWTNYGWPKDIGLAKDKKKAGISWTKMQQYIHHQLYRNTDKMSNHDKFNIDKDSNENDQYLKSINVFGDDYCESLVVDLDNEPEDKTNWETWTTIKSSQ